MLRMILLGVGTGVPDPDRENTHMIWQHPDGLLLIDAGGSTYQRILRANLDPLQVRDIVITHSHTDHINGLPALLFSLKLAGYSGRLRIFANQPTIDTLQHILAAFELGEYQAAADWIPIEAGQEIPLGSPHFRLQTAATSHSRPCLALRFEATKSRTALVYSADTEPCAEVQQLANGATVLIHEATTPEPFPGHSSPRQAGEVAAAAGAERLVLVHFSPRYTMSAAQAIDEVRAGGFHGEIEIGREFGEHRIG
jgi:ribonuclease Z